MEGPGSSGANQINLENMKNNSKAYETYMNRKKVFQNAVCRFPEVINDDVPGGYVCIFVES